MAMHRYIGRLAVVWGTLGGWLPATSLAQNGASPSTPPVDVDPTIDFDRQIRPILSDFCFGCHGPDSESRQADLRLDHSEGLFAHRAELVIVDPGRPGSSELLRRVLTDDEEQRMPPSSTGRSLSQAQRDLLTRWIEQGALWQPHWAFAAPKANRPPPPAGGAWAENPIDRFVAERLKQVGMEPSRPATRETLIRRVMLDLIGLPPTPAEVDNFVSDQRPDAYARLVDRLLASPHLGERLAIDWLDGARYADTSGYQNDGPRHMWRWRDWVIEAFNRNQPFDQFTIEQLAGDLLPDATLDQKIATGFQRNHRGNAEGGIVPEEYAVEYVVDRVETTSAVWLGLTMGCARCHHHKYDPVTQREFYQLFAFFNNVPEKGRAIKEGNSPPFLRAPTERQQRHLAALRAEYDHQVERWAKVEVELTQLQTQWESQGLTEQPSLPLTWSPTDSLRMHFDGQQVRGPDAAQFTYRQTPHHVAGPIELALPSDGSQWVEVPAAGALGYFDKFTLSAWIRPTKASGAVVSRMVDVAEGEGYCLMLRDGRLQLNLVKRWLDDSLRVESTGTVALDQWTHVAATYDGSRTASAVRLYLNGQPAANHVLLDQLNQTFASTEPLRIGAGNGPDFRFAGDLDEVLVYHCVLTPVEIATLASPATLKQIVHTEPHRRTAGERDKLASYFRDHVAPPSYRKAYELLARMGHEYQLAAESTPTVMVMEELLEPRTTYLLARGQYDQPQEPVQPDVPSCLPALPPSVPRNRLTFARWLVSPEQPLTARVIVNRYWQLLLGKGLVRTPEDFGLQGERPTHPELLDWLSIEFRRSGWDLKHLLRTIVTSATYQQESAGTPESWQSDPDNRWLSRGPRFRLSAELIRDQVLAASQLLTLQLGGPSEKPYQPEGLWGEIASDVDYSTSTGAGLYRRSVYTYWKRTVAPPGMLTFDAPARETCVVRRSVTNTPLQALLLMNEEGFLEAARRLAERSLQAFPGAARERMIFAFRLVLARQPREAELNVLLRTYDEFAVRYRQDPVAAAAAVNIGSSRPDPNLDVSELAAQTAVTSLILNLDEAVTKE